MASLSSRISFSLEYLAVTPEALVNWIEQSHTTKNNLGTIPATSFCSKSSEANGGRKYNGA